MTDYRMRASKGYPGRTHRLARSLALALAEGRAWLAGLQAGWHVSQRTCWSFPPSKLCWPAPACLLHFCRYWRGEAPLYTFGYGLSYTVFRLASPLLAATPGSGVTASVTLSNNGSVAGQNVVLAFLSFLGPAAGPVRPQAPEPRLVLPSSGCKRGVPSTDLVQALAAYQRSATLAPGASQRLSFWLPLTGGSNSAWAGFGDPEPPCGGYALRFGATEPAAATIILAL